MSIGDFNVVNSAGGHVHTIQTGLTSGDQYYIYEEEFNKAPELKASDFKTNWGITYYDADTHLRDLVLLMAKLLKPHIIDDEVVSTIEKLQIALGDYSFTPKVEPERHLDNDLFEL